MSISVASHAHEGYWHCQQFLRLISIVNTQRDQPPPSQVVHARDNLVEAKLGCFDQYKHFSA